MSQYIELAKLIDEHGISKVVGVLKEWESKQQESCENCSGFGYIRQLYTEGEITNCKLCEGGKKIETPKRECKTCEGYGFYIDNDLIFCADCEGGKNE